MGSLLERFASIVDMDRAVSNARLLDQYARERRGIFSKSYAELHPQITLPPSIEEGTVRAAKYRFLGGGVDLRDSSYRLWPRHREFFTEHDIDDVVSWSHTQEAVYLRTINKFVLDSFAKHDRQGIVPGWMRWFDTELDMSKSASENRESLRGHFWLKKHLSGIMLLYVYETLGQPLDIEFSPKADLHDVNFSLTTGEIRAEPKLPNRTQLEFITADIMRQVPDMAGVDKIQYKANRWALMVQEFGQRLNRANYHRRFEILSGLHVTYPGLFRSRTVSFVALRSASFYTIRNETEAPSLFDVPQ